MTPQFLFQNSLEKQIIIRYILRVLRNEKYCGDLIQKKTYTPSYLTHEKKYNRGTEELVVIRDHHEPIFSREMFDMVNSNELALIFKDGKLIIQPNPIN